MFNVVCDCCLFNISFFFLHQTSFGFRSNKKMKKKKIMPNIIFEKPLNLLTFIIEHVMSYMRTDTSSMHRVRMCNIFLKSILYALCIYQTHEHSFE